MNARHLTFFLLYLLSYNLYAGSFFPSFEEWKDSVVYALKDPATWVPISGALLIKATNSDERISEWATSKKLVIGNNSNNTSDFLKDALNALAVGSLIFSPQQQPEENNWALEKGGRLIKSYISAGAATFTTSRLKTQFNRERPNVEESQKDKDCGSLPSGHSTEAFSWAAITRRNLEDYDLPDTSKIAWNIGIYTAASTAAWERVELKEHYPTDVLAGAAIGNFLATTIYRAFVGPSAKIDMNVSISPMTKGLVLNLNLNL